tara:strand:+ start:2847 stop:3365 length:519 start_codon:yes stop_codon:yes gene_type:complete
VVAFGAAIGHRVVIAELAVVRTTKAAILMQEIVHWQTSIQIVMTAIHNPACQVLELALPPMVQVVESATPPPLAIQLTMAMLHRKMTTAQETSAVAMGRHFALNNLVGQMRVAIIVNIYQAPAILGLMQEQKHFSVGVVALTSRITFRRGSLTQRWLQVTIHPMGNVMSLGF